MHGRHAGDPRERHTQALRRPRGAKGRVLRRPSRQRREHDRRQRLGEEHAAALHQPARGADQGRSLPRRRADGLRRGRRRAQEAAVAGRDQPAAPRPRHGLPAVQPLAAHDGARQRHRGADARARPAARGGRRARRGGTRAGALGREARRLSRPSLRRAAAARRDRPRARDAAQGDALRRGDVLPRPRAHRGGPRGDARARAARHDYDRGHPRDALRARGLGRGDVPARWRDRGERPARAGLRRAALGALPPVPVPLSKFLGQAR